MCSKDNSALAYVCKDILTNLDLPPLQRLMETAEESGRYQSTRLTRFLSSLQAIAVLLLCLVCLVLFSV